jgi:hypothetical protein
MKTMLVVWTIVAALMAAAPIGKARAAATREACQILAPNWA